MRGTMKYVLVALPGGWELLLIIFVIVLLFGAKKLPELARGSGQALRIFKNETKGLTEDNSRAELDGNAGQSESDRAPERGEGPTPH